METSLLFEPYRLGKLNLKNRIVMSSMTRSRATENTPNELMAIYYQQRAGAGLIISEGTSPSPNGLGYENIPGIFNTRQIEGWRRITNAVHWAGSKIFLQLMHTGRISHLNNMPSGTRVLSASNIQAKGQIYTAQGLSAYPVPEEMTAADIEHTKQEYVQAAINAIRAGFDGVEINAANGYLLEQFIHPSTNRRADLYGGGIENRTRFTLEIVEAICSAIGKDKVGIRFSPYSTLNDMPLYNTVNLTYLYLIKQMEKLEILYVHLVDNSKYGSQAIEAHLKESMRRNFDGSFILAGGYTKGKAEKDIEEDRGDLIAFGKSFISNPDLVERLENDWPLDTTIHYNYLYTKGEEGYIDYPSFAEECMYV